MLRFLGIDYGEAKIGLALENNEDRLSLPYKILSEEDFFKQIHSIIEDEEINEIVVGLPMNMKNEETQQTGKTNIFIEKLKNVIDLPVYIEDERMTSIMGGKLIRSHGEKSKKQDDASAASLILESFIRRKYGV